MNGLAERTSRRSVLGASLASLALALFSGDSEGQERKPMSVQVVELVTFTLAQGSSEAAFLSASEAATAFLKARKGFVSRRLSRGAGGSYTDHVVWATLADAQAAMEASMKEPALAAFMQAIDMASIKLDHQELLVSVN